MRSLLAALFAVTPLVAAAQPAERVALAGEVELRGEVVWLRTGEDQAVALRGKKAQRLARFAGRQVQVTTSPARLVLDIVSPARAVLDGRVVEVDRERRLVTEEGEFSLRDPEGLLEAGRTYTVDAWIFEDEGEAWVEAYEAETTGTWTVFRKTPRGLQPSGFVRGSRRAVWVTARRDEVVAVRRGRHEGWVTADKVEATAPPVEPRAGIIERLR